ncbi:TonB-dependent receptor [Maricurvus nonylphenolicus]|uniref:TonB-dependent receptor n=1 Tax=Maricurvus nonylphenolicus TaxID=1008307 RepID=UPI0036F2729D
MKSLFRISPLAASVVATVGLSPFSVAEETFTLEEIVVTAQKREESLQDVPISVSAMSGEKINEAAIPSMMDFAAYVPNFAVAPLALGDVVSIRGIQSGVLASIEQSVGSFVDGIYRGRATQSRFSFLDVGMVEVLRGPQSILFGKNTIAGAVNITSAKPMDEFAAELSGLYEVEHEETEIKGYVSGLLTENLRGRLAWLTRDMDEGWIENEFNDKHEPLTDEIAGRVSLEWDATENLLVSFKYEMGDWDNLGGSTDQIVLTPTMEGLMQAAGYDATPANGKTAIGNTTPGIDYPGQGYFKGDSDETALRVDYSTDKGTVTLIAGYSGYEFDRAVDADFYNSPVEIGFEEVETYDQESLELRYVSEFGEGFEFISGLYYQQSDLDSQAKSLVNNTGLLLNRYAYLEQESESWSAFAQGTWEVRDDVRVTLGARYGEEEKSAAQGVHCAEWDTFTANDALATCATNQFLLEFTPHDFTDLKRDEENWTYSVNAQWDVTPDVMLYSTLSTGTKGGGFNNFALTDDPAEAEFEEEKVKSIEVGAKMTLLNGAAEVNVALFDMDYEDLQSSVYTGNSGFVVKNASSADITGLEIDGRWQLSESLMLRGSAGYVDFTYADYDTAGCTQAQIAAYTGSGACSQDLSGESTPFTPEWTGSLSLEHEIELTQQLFLRTVIDANYKGEHSTAADNDPVSMQDAYTLWNLTLTLGAVNERWDVSLVGRNLTDEEYYIYSNDVPFSNGGHQASFGRGANYAVRGRLKF